MLHDAAATPRARRHDANLQRILDAAMSLVAEGGLDALSMTRLAAVVDYTPGALYRYVESKDALLSKLVERTLVDLREQLDRASARLSVKASPLARVFALVQGYRAFAHREPHRFGLLAATLAEPRVLLREAKDVEPVARALIAAMQPLAGALAAAEEAGLLTPGEPAERTLCVFAMLEGVLLMQKLAHRAPGMVDVERLALGGTRALLVGWGARPRTVDAAIAKVAAGGAA
jgi:AcrR family transcriptional regulator